MAMNKTINQEKEVEGSEGVVMGGRREKRKQGERTKGFGRALYSTNSKTAYPLIWNKLAR
jgi:hypothetical protein